MATSELVVRYILGVYFLCEVCLEEQEEYKNYLGITPLNVLVSYLHLRKTILQIKLQICEIQAHQN